MTQLRDDVGPSPPTLESLFRTQRLPIVRLAHLITGSNALAEEIVQEAFIRLQNNWHRADNPAAYLRTIVTNLCKTQLRRRDRERRLDQPARPTRFQRQSSAAAQTRGTGLAQRRRATFRTPVDIYCSERPR